MNVLKKRATIIFMLILLGGILFGCSNIKSEQSSIIDSEIEKKIEEIVIGGDLPLAAWIQAEKLTMLAETAIAPPLMIFELSMSLWRCSFYPV